MIFGEEHHRENERHRQSDDVKEPIGGMLMPLGVVPQESPEHRPDSLKIKEPQA